jgi:PPE-repeat protein
MIVNAGKKDIATAHIAATYTKIKIGNGGDDTAASQTKLDAEIPNLTKNIIPSVMGNQLIWSASFTGTEIGTQGVSELGIFNAAGTLLSRVTFTNTGVVPSTDTVTFTIRLEVD